METFCFRAGRTPRRQGGTGRRRRHLEQGGRDAARVTRAWQSLRPFDDRPRGRRVAAPARPLRFSWLRTPEVRFFEPLLAAMRLSVRSLVTPEYRFTALRLFSAAPYLAPSSPFTTLPDPFRADVKSLVLVRSTRGRDSPLLKPLLLPEEFSAYLG